MPNLDYRLQHYYVTYNRISRSRDVSMSGPLPIKASEILAYCNLFDIQSQIERERLFNHVVNLDNAYLEYLRKRQDAEKPAKA